MAVVVLLPFVPVTAITGAVQVLEGQLELGDAAHTAQARVLSSAARGRNARADHQQVARGQPLDGVPAQLDFGAARLQRRARSAAVPECRRESDT